MRRSVEQSAEWSEDQRGAESAPSSDSDGASSCLYRCSTVPSSLTDSAISVSACTASLAEGGNQEDDDGTTSTSSESAGAKLQPTDGPQTTASDGKSVRRKPPLVRLLGKKLNKRKSS